MRDIFAVSFHVYSTDELSRRLEVIPSYADKWKISMLKLFVAEFLPRSVDKVPGLEKAS